VTEDKKPADETKKQFGAWIAIGVAVGTVLGVAMDNIAIGV
jgi:hypothetical protein